MLYEVITRVSNCTFRIYTSICEKGGQQMKNFFAFVITIGLGILIILSLSNNPLFKPFGEAKKEETPKDEGKTEEAAMEGLSSLFVV